MTTFKNFNNRIAVITGGASGIGREILFQLVQKGTHVAVCDIDAEKMESVASKAKKLNPTVRVTTHFHDISKEQEVKSLVKEVIDKHSTDSIHLLFNNAGIVGGRSFVKDTREEWEKTFSVSWQGTYLCTRQFLPVLLKANQGVVINISSISGLWASLGNKAPHSAYSTAKFAIRGFTESLVVDFKANAPYLSAVLVIPGHVRTGMPSPPKSYRKSYNGLFEDYTPCSAKSAAEIIINAIMNGEWRVVIGEDAKAIEMVIREDPNSIYD